MRPKRTTLPHPEPEPQVFFFPRGLWGQSAIWHFFSFSLLQNKTMVWFPDLEPPFPVLERPSLFLNVPSCFRMYFSGYRMSFPCFRSVLVCSFPRLTCPSFSRSFGAWGLKCWLWPTLTPYYWGFRLGVPEAGPRPRHTSARFVIFERRPESWEFCHIVLHS